MTVVLRYHNGNQYLHRKSADYRSRVKRKIRAYHAFIQAAVVAQGLLQYLAVIAPKLVWDSFGSWLRTIRPGIPPSEFVVANALDRNKYRLVDLGWLTSFKTNINDVEYQVTEKGRAAPGDNPHD